MTAIKTTSKIYPWFEVAPQISTAAGFGPVEELDLATELNKSIQTGELQCWHADGRPMDTSIGVPLEDQRKKVPHLTAEAVNNWFTGKGYLLRWEPEHKVEKPLRSQAESSIWKELAAVRAREIIKDAQLNDFYPSQDNLADQIAREFRKAEIFGKDGKPLTGSTIKRHALKGISSAVNKQLSTAKRLGK